MFGHHVLGVFKMYAGRWEVSTPSKDAHTYAGKFFLKSVLYQCMNIPSLASLNQLSIPGDCFALNLNGLKSVPVTIVITAKDAINIGSL